MSDVFFEELEIPRPDYFLGVGSRAHGAQTGRMIEAVEQVLMKENPDWVLVYGDTNSTLAGAVAAVKLHVPVAHVEAGLRSFNRQMPEEINRVLTDHTSDLLFAPTETAVKNLRREGIAEGGIHLVGDVMYDATVYYGSKAERESRVLERYSLEPKEYILATIHRAESTDDPVRLRAIFEGLALVSKEVPVVLPLHPRTRAALEREKALEIMAQYICLIEPVGYLDMVMLEKHAHMIVTESGGVQKESFFCKVPCVVLREETEWVELVELGWAQLVPPVDADEVRTGVLNFSMAGANTEFPNGHLLYGDGHAAERIVELLKTKS